MKGCIEACEDKGRVLVIVCINVKVGDSEVEGVAVKSALSRINENGRNFIELCTEMYLSV